MHCGLSQKLKTNRWLGGLHQWLKAGRGTSDDDLMVGWIHYRVRRITYLLIRSSSTVFCSMTCTSRVKYTFKMSDSLVLWRLISLRQRTKTSHLTSACSSWQGEVTSGFHSRVKWHGSSRGYLSAQQWWKRDTWAETHNTDTHSLSAQSVEVPDVGGWIVFHLSSFKQCFSITSVCAEFGNWTKMYQQVSATIVPQASVQLSTFPVRFYQVTPKDDNMKKKINTFFITGLAFLSN